MSRLFGPTNTNANLIYVLYLFSVLMWVTMPIGLIFAYVNRGKAEEWLQTHYSFQIRTFWLAHLYFVLCLPFLLVVFGYAVFGLILIWFLVRMVKGLQALGKREAVKNHRRWIF